MSISETVIAVLIAIFLTFITAISMSESVFVKDCAALGKHRVDKTVIICSVEVTK